jgi:hypothetical protein
MGINANRCGSSVPGILAGFARAAKNLLFPRYIRRALSPILKLRNSTEPPLAVFWEDGSVSQHKGVVRSIGSSRQDRPNGETRNYRRRPAA